MERVASGRRRGAILGRVRGERERRWGGRGGGEGSGGARREVGGAARGGSAGVVRRRVADETGRRQELKDGRKGGEG